MRNEISAELKPHVKKVMDGDLLNVPLLHRHQDQQITYYCIGKLNEAISDLRGEVYEAIAQLKRLQMRFDSGQNARRKK